jgi:hypothetical protein
MTCCTQAAPTAFFAALSHEAGRASGPVLTLRALQPFSSGTQHHPQGQIFTAPEPEASILINAGLAQALDNP